jgi:hypothetical protein
VRAHVLFGALLLLFACGHAAAPSGGGDPFEDFASIAPRVGELAPAFELRDLDGATVRLSDATARGPVVLVFGSFS